MGLSAVIIMKDEERNIRACLESVRFADETVVVDSGSRDASLTLAKPIATKLLSRPFDDFASQKNFAVSHATQDWVFVIDADERVSPELRDEILRVIAVPDAAAAYAVRRRTNLFGRDFIASGLQGDAPLRLFRRGKAVFQGLVHETLSVDGKTGKLNAVLTHRSFQTVHEHLEKLQLYTDLEARRDIRKKSKAPAGRFLLRPFWRFFSIYVLKQGFRDGREGFFYAILSSFYESVRWMKRWEIDERA